MRSYIRRIEDITGDYKLSSDFAHLKELIDCGKKVICIAVCKLYTYESEPYKERVLGVLYRRTYEGHWDDYRFEWSDDVCEYESLDFTDDIVTFKKWVHKLNLRYIEPI